MTILWRNRISEALELRPHIGGRHRTVLLGFLELSAMKNVPTAFQELSLKLEIRKRVWVGKHESFGPELCPLNCLPHAPDHEVAVESRQRS